MDAGAIFKPSDDRRRDERRLFRGGAVWAPVGQSPAQVRTVDLSASGIALVSSTNPPIGCRCRVHFYLPMREGGNKAVDLMATVARSSFSAAEGGFRVGLEFEAPDAEAMRVIKRFIGA